MYEYTNKLYFWGLIGQLGLTEPSYYYYLNQSGTYSVDGTNDVKEYEENDDLVFLSVEGKRAGKTINVVVINL